MAASGKPENLEKAGEIFLKVVGNYYQDTKSKKSKTEMKKVLEKIETEFNKPIKFRVQDEYRQEMGLAQDDPISQRLNQKTTVTRGIRTDFPEKIKKQRNRN